MPKRHAELTPLPMTLTLPPKGQPGIPTLPLPLPPKGQPEQHPTHPTLQQPKQQLTLVELPHEQLLRSKPPRNLRCPSRMLGTQLRLQPVQP